jgi:succinate dehydrogenase flavin-adding protein (antitoxin of CptAB toxin-antitoxin module)
MNIDHVIRYKSRRGLLELDLVLGDFYENEYESLSLIEKNALLKILKKQDNDLWNILSTRNLRELIKEEVSDDK